MEKKIKLFIIALNFIFNIIKKNKYHFENELIRFIKFNRKNISIDYSEEEILSIINYIKSVKEKKYKIISYNKKKKKLVSFISPVFNQINYLYPFISSIQNQKLKDYELIFIDDFSIDNSSEFILEQLKEDKRIKLIKNKKNMGALYSRYLGQKFSQSKYSIFVDCDDIVLKDGIFQSYNHIIKYNLDIVQFLALCQTDNAISIKTMHYKYKKIIYKPILSYIFYYDYKSHKGNELNSILWTKLIKTKIVNKAFEFIGYSYLEKNIIIHNDLIILFSIFQIANSYQHIKAFGYFYINNNPKSTVNSYKNIQKKNKIINSFFLNVQFLYEKTNNTYLDKLFSIFKIIDYFKKYKKLFINLNNDEYIYIKRLIDKMINLNYLSIEDKLILTEIELFTLNLKNIK